MWKFVPWIALVIVIAGLVGLLVVQRVASASWSDLPDEPIPAIDARWAEVGRLAARSPECARNPADLALAERGARMIPARDAERIVADEDGATPVIGEASLATESIEALDRLVAWRDNGGGFSADLCGDDRKPLSLLDLSRLAAARWEGGPDDARLDAALALARSMRRCGNLVEVSAGFAAARIFVRAASFRGAAPWPRFVEQGPTVDEVLPAVARDAVCTYRMVETALGRGEVDRDRSLGGPGGLPWFLPTSFEPERELLVMRKKLADRVLAAARYPRDLEQMAQALERADDAARLRTRIDGLIFPTAAPVRLMRQVLDEHGAYVLGEVTSPADRPRSPR